MFKSLPWKLVTAFVLLVLAIMTVAGTFLCLRTMQYYQDTFYEQMSGVLNQELVTSLSQSEATKKTYIAEALTGSVSTRLGADNGRFYYVVSAEDCAVLGGNSFASSGFFMESKNFVTALSGSVGNASDITAKYMDYAVPVETPFGKQIIYVRDTKKELNGVLLHFLESFIQTVVIGVLCAILVGFLFSRAITTPLSHLTKRARRISEGEFDSRTEIPNSSTEVEKLNEAFNDMSLKLKGTLSDISTEKNKIEAILQNMTDGVVAFGTDGKIIHINSTAKKMFGMKNIEKYRFDKLFSMLGANILIGDLLYLDNVRSCERIATKGDASFKVNFAVFDDERNKTGGVLAVMHDITKQQKLENSRREFVANVSHELRTPLTTVKSYAETILDVVKDNKTAITFTNTILNETDRMTRLVKDLLVLSSLENQAPLNKTMFSIRKMVNEVVSTMSLVASDKGHRLKFVQLSEIPSFYGDRDKLEQVLYNIISNSIKYTPNGGKITVRMNREFNDIIIEVEDTGIGIPEKDLSRIFERFYRVDKARSRELGGTGLGLAISKGIIDAHGGTISLSSVYHEGTTVKISLPIKK